MNKITVNFENCYGIKSLSHEFDTSKGFTFLIYAPNGSMKTSFARVFQDISQGRTPSDFIFPKRETKFSIKDENGNDIPGDQIFVVEPNTETFNSTRTATLLVNQELRTQYERAITTINNSADQVLKILGEISQTKKYVRRELAVSFGVDEKDILVILEQLSALVKQTENPGFEKIIYTDIFNEKVIQFLSSESMRKQLKEYVERYNELISKSSYFRRGLFDHNNATNVGKSLKDNGFFDAHHKVLLTDQASKGIEVTTQEDLDRIISKEKQQILSDTQLSKRFEAIDKAITKNIELRQFRRFVENNPEILPEFLDLDTFRKKIWISYSFFASSELESFLSFYQAAKNEIAQVIERAKKEETEWRTVLSIFHERFSVPFTLEIVNQEDVILKNETPSLVFRYSDGDEIREIGREELINALSIGERRALYLLNVIFDIQSLMKEPNETVLILDDIADSFDYKNKYAIIEYIKTIQDSRKFVMFVLTHNFDFYRTVQSRVGIHRSICLMAFKSTERVVLKKAEYLNPFDYWRKALTKDGNICEQIACDKKSCSHSFCNQKIIIAIIPMIRNLIEYMTGTESEDYNLLTSLLHIKDQTNDLTVRSLAEITNKVLATTITANSEKVLTLLYHQADSCSEELDSVNLENKIILSIAIRILAEKFMLREIGDPSITSRIESNQTRILFDGYKQRFSDQIENIKILEKVMLMTPEAIHLNSFMYEPIIDISDTHLRSLYTELKTMAG